MSATPQKTQDLVDSMSRYPRFMPKTPDELREQLERENEKPHSDDRDLTAEGLSVPRPARSDFFGNLAKVSEPDQADD